VTGEPGRLPAARVRLIRHAQASFGSADYDRLSARGEHQAQHLARWLVAESRRPFGHVVRGSMLRHAQTLAPIEQAFADAGRPLPAARIDPAWNEFDHEAILRAYAAIHPDHDELARARGGEWNAIRSLLLGALQAWRSGALDTSVPESWSTFSARVAEARAGLAGVDGDVLIVSSGGAISRCAQAALDLDDARMIELNMALRNTGLSDFHRGAERWRMLSWNELPHLAAPDNQALASHY
jgi:broad specificity phosphatase PhoE